MEGAKILELVMFWIFEKGTSVITFNPVGLAMPIPGLLGKMVPRPDDLQRKLRYGHDNDGTNYG